MKTLIFNGSSKKNGDTQALINEFVKYLNGDIKIVSCYNDISPCNDCRYCWSAQGCAMNDEMQGIYPYLEDCDNIVLASPIWFSSLSGPLLNLSSRIQTNWAGGYFRKEKRSPKLKNGVLIIVGAEDGTEIVPTQTALTIMKFMNVYRSDVIKIYSLDTNNLAAEKDETALYKCREAAKKLNEVCSI